MNSVYLNKLESAMVKYSDLSQTETSKWIIFCMCPFSRAYGNFVLRASHPDPCSCGENAV